jgi:predicted PurR-regulated permease PerM
MLSIAQDIILPLIYASIIAILVSPIVDFLVKRKINRAISIVGVLIISILILIVFISLLSSQTSRISEAWPELTDKFQELLNQTVFWASEYFDIRTKTINDWITDTKEGFINNSNTVIGHTLTTTVGVLAAVLLTPVYTCMILFYQPFLVEFIHRVFGADNDSKVSEILIETRKIVKSYLVGLFIQFVIVSFLNSVGLLIIGIQYAILLGVLASLLNVIPYLGGFMGATIFMIIALVTKSPVYVLYVLALYLIVQFIDNNFIVPKIIGSKVKINALVSLIAVIAGAALWGIPGMFLSIPLIAIIKLILDRIDSLKPWGFLLGDNSPPLVKLNLDFKDISKKLPRI